LFFILTVVTIYNMDIRQELKILLIKRGSSMRKLVRDTRNMHFDIPNESTISAELMNKRIRFQTVEDILDYLGYELIIREKH